MGNRAEKIEVEADKIERELVLIGSTAIEDKLQDEVGKHSS
jgi:phospholipid-transporting ATPase